MAYIFAAKRSAIGTFGGSLAQQSMSETAGAVIAAALDAADVDKTQVDEIIMGHVIAAGQGMNPARQAAFAAGISKEKTAFAINQVCASGLRAVGLAAQAVDAAEMDCVIAGGMEAMSQSPHAVFLREGKKLGDAALTDLMQHDGLYCALADCGMGLTAENLAEQYQITRAEQDEFALRSQTKTAEAINSGAFAEEIHPITLTIRKKQVTFAQDEHPRDTSAQSLAALKPAFKKDGSVTAGNSSGINDGAAALVIGGEALAEKSSAMARIVGVTTGGVAPEIMGIGPVSAIAKLLAKTDMTIADIDLFELNEAFAAQSLAVIREANLPLERVNIHGGAIALGHPLGASGARVLVTLIHALKRHGGKRGIAALCAGGGMGIALMVELV